MVKWKSISTKILVSYLTVVFCTFLVTALAFYPMLVGVLEKRAEIGLEKQAWEIAYTIGLGIEPSTPQKPPLTILLLGRSVESDFLWIDKEDRIVFSSQPDQFPIGITMTQLQQNLREKQDLDRSKASLFKNDRYIAAEVPVSGGGTVLTFVALSSLQAMNQETLLMIFGSLLAALLMALLIAFFWIRYLMKPLRSLEDYAQAVGNRQFDRRLEIRSNDELAALANAFNEMADRLKTYDESQRRFFQNASHELKTPLMSINGYAEGIRDGLFIGPALDNAVEIIHKESLRLRNIVENMIDITILEQPHETYFLPHELNSLLEEARNTVGGYALERGLVIELRVPDRAWVVGDWDQLHSLFVNLLSNALNHAVSMVTVDAVLIENHTRVMIKVRDDGAGFTPSDLEHAFDYFYTGNHSGSGLGLTIVKKIVAEHSGTIRIYNAASAGAVAEVILPAARMPPI